MRLIALALTLTAALQLDAQQPPPRVLESFDDVAAFRAVPSDGVLLSLRADTGVAGRALRMEFDFQGHAGYAVAHRAFSLPPLPAHWVMTLWVRGAARPNTLELKLVDSTGQNVWWMRKPDLVVTGQWTQLRFRSTDLSYAWGPLGGGAPRKIAALEISFTAGQGGRGWLALDNLVLQRLNAPVADSVRPHLSASSQTAAQPANAALPTDFAISPRGTSRLGDSTEWRSTASGEQWLTLDFRGTRHLSGLVLDWSTTEWPSSYDVEASDDGARWTLLRAVRGSAGGRRYVHLPLTETSHLRIAMHAGPGRFYALHALHILSDSAAGTRSAFLERVAEGSAAGLYPRPFTHQQSYWTVLGVPRDERDGLISEDGSVESRPGGFSVEPFLVVDDTILSWKDGVTTHSLDEGWRPIPTARRTTKDAELATTAFAAGAPGASVILVRYRVVNRAATARTMTLVAAVRPIQVDPPWQFLGVPGGAARVENLTTDGRTIVVNDTDHVIPITKPSAIGLSTFDGGGLRGAMIASSGVRDSVHDVSGFAEGTIRWTLALAPRDSAVVWLALPAAAMPTPRPGAGESSLAETRALWDREAVRTSIELPGDGAPIASTVRSALAWILINARGPAIQPGTRSYRRSWIRDGALTSSALLRLGHATVVRAFLDWYVPHVFGDGKVPCCVDARGSDPVTENDADGELLYLAAEYLRISHDTATIMRHWPKLRHVASHLDSLRNSRRSATYKRGDSLIVFGLLPPSISHEGYSAKPAYSYWDDWWGVRGLDDAGMLARVAHDDAASRRFAGGGREMRRDVVASVARSMAHFHMQALPGAAELGDLDPTSSTIALEPAQALGDLPRAAVTATFDSAWAVLQRRLAPDSRWTSFTPYEWRDVGAFIRLDESERADAYSAWLMTMRRPAAWNEWAEVVWRDLRAPKFIGDMPHGWVLSDFIRATLDRIAYERERDSVLVVGAGIPDRWARDARGVEVHGMQTWWGRLDLTIHGDARSVKMEVAGVSPPGGVELRVPFGRRATRATVNGRVVPLTHDGRAVMVRAPAVVELFP